MEMLLHLIILFYLLVFGIAIFWFAFADVENEGILGTVSRALLITAPRAIRRAIKAIFGERIYNGCYGAVKYAVYERNPILQCVYLTIINSAFMGWLIYGAPLLPTLFAGTIHIYGGYIGVIICQWTFYMACSTGPGTITKDNVNCFAHQPYDGLLFTSGLYCTTCKVEKPARSKHCTLCGICVPVFDHHCVWLNQCVGEHNYKWFISFLFVNSMFLFYGATVIFLVLISKAYEQNLFTTTFVNRRTGEEFKASYYMIIMYLLNTNLGLVVVFLVAAIMGLAIFCFFAYHFYLLCIGQTTNETFKWTSYKQVHKIMVESHHRYKAQLKYNQIQPEVRDGTATTSNEPDTATAPVILSTATVAATTSDKEITVSGSLPTSESTNDSDEVPEPTTDEQEPDDTKAVIRRAANLDDSSLVGCMPTTATVPIIMTSIDVKNNKVAKPVAKHLMRVIAEDQRGIPNLLVNDPGVFPTNIYNVGLIKNLRRVFWPPSVPLLAKATTEKKLK